MRMTKKLSGVVLALGLCALAASGAYAQTGSKTEPFTVSIEIQNTCTVLTPGNIVFTATSAQPGTRNAQGQIVVRCSIDHDYSIALDGGTHSGSTTRNMRGPGSTGTTDIAYALYRDAGLTVAWGSGTEFGAVYPGKGGGLDKDQVVDVYARATLVGTEPVGTYTDTVTATLSF